MPAGGKAIAHGLENVLDPCDEKKAELFTAATNGARRSSGKLTIQKLGKASRVPALA